MTMVLQRMVANLVNEMILPPKRKADEPRVVIAPAVILTPMF